MTTLGVLTASGLAYGHRPANSAWPQQRIAWAVFATGAALGWFAWQPHGAVALIALLPFLWTRQPTRSAASLLWIGYFLAGSRDVVPVVVRFFPEASAAFGVLLWLFAALVLALPWVLLWPSDGASPRAVAARTAAAMLLFTVPPSGCIAWLSPLLASGVLYPAWGWIGIACTIVFFVSLAVMGYGTRVGNTVWMFSGVLIATGALMAAVGANVAYRPPAPPPGWVALDTHFGRFPSADPRAAFERQQALMGIAAEAIRAGAKVVIFPEEVAGTWRTAVDFWWRPLDEFAARQGATVLVGADIPISHGVREGAARRFTDSLVMLGAVRGTIDARLPVPVGSWRPWSGTHAAADPFRSGVADIHGVRAAVSICYEDFLAWPILVSFARRPQPQLVISAANNWFFDGLDSQWIQRRSIELWARLFGVPLLRAVNR